MTSHRRKFIVHLVKLVYFLLVCFLVDAYCSALLFIFFLLCLLFVIFQSIYGGGEERFLLGDHILFWFIVACDLLLAISQFVALLAIACLLMCDRVFIESISFLHVYCILALVRKKMTFSAGKVIFWWFLSTFSEESDTWKALWFSCELTRFVCKS